MTRFPVILLCAGGSTRMGRAKPLLSLGGLPLVVHHVRAFEDAGLDVTIVTGRDADAVTAAVPGARRVHNPRWAETQPLDSLRLGLAAIDPSQGLLVSPVDVAPASPAVLSALIGRPSSAVPRGPDGLEGHPVWVGPQDVARLHESLSDGLRGLLVGAERVRVAERVGEDFDDPVAWERFVGRRS